MNEQEKQKNIGAGSIIKAVLFGVILFFVLVSVCALIFSHFTLNASYIPTVFYIIMFLCAFLTGMSSSSAHRQKGYLRGLISGIIFVVIFAIIFSFLKKPVTGKTYITYLIALLLSTAGGITGVNSK